jgi:ferredoxin
MTNRLRVDPIACTGHGICAELLPELIRLDDWGYPILEGSDVPRPLLADARRAVTACPELALTLERREEERYRPRSDRRPRSKTAAGK